MRVNQEAWSSAEPYEPFMGRWSRLLAAEVAAWIDPAAVCAGCTSAVAPEP
jgi:hypothetical protein